MSAKINESQVIQNTRRMDWHLFWTAAGVVVSLGVLIVTCFKSLSSDIRQIDQRLSKLEGSFEERGKWQSRQFVVEEKRQ